jgi:hypothetical protein
MRRDPLARCRARPAPDDWGDDESMTLVEAVTVFFAEGPLTVSSLRTEIANGRLATAKVSGRYFVTPANLKALFEPRTLPCPESQKAPAFTFARPGQTGGRKPSMSSEMVERKSAQAAARMTLKALKKRSGNTSGQSADQRPNRGEREIPMMS